MKCRNCGHTEVGLYKEIKSLIAEMGITKEDVQNEIRRTVDSYVRSAISENISKYVKEFAEEIVRKEFDNHTWSRPTKTKEILAECIRNTVAEEVSRSVTISISINNKEATQ